MLQDTRYDIVYSSSIVGKLFSGLYTPILVTYFRTTHLFLDVAYYFGKLISGRRTGLGVNEIATT